MTPSVWDGILLGLIQGLTEFLPISSSGHLVLAEDLLGYRPPGVAFEVGLHVATLLSVLIYYRDRIGRLVVGLFARDREAWRFAALLVLASVPAAVVGVGLRDYITRLFDAGPWLGVSFLCTGLILWLTRYVRPPAAHPAISPAAALGVGAAQAIAIIPGISRSGTTIAAGLWLGLAPAAAAEFSFLMAVIAIGGSGLLELRHLDGGVGLASPGFAAAFLTALVSGVWAIRFLVALLRRQRLHGFAWYLLMVGAFTILWYLRP